MVDGQHRPEQRAPETCPMCGGLTRGGDADASESELAYLLRYLWTTKEAMPDD